MFLSPNERPLLMNTLSPSRSHASSPDSSRALPRTAAALLTVLVLLAVLAGLAGLVMPQSAAADTAESEAPADAGPSTVWSLTPSAEEDSDDQRVSFRHTVAPGESVEDSIELTNFSAQEATFTLQAADGVVSESGTFDILQPGEENEAAGQWIELEQTEVTVAADESVTVPFTLTVPENATPGDHPAGIAASVSAGAEENMSMVSRVGTRIHLRVDGEIMPTLSVEGLSADYQQNWNPFAPGTATVTWTVRNDGNVRLGAEQALQSSGLFGLAAADADVEPIREVLPGGQTQVQVEHQVWPLFALNSAVDLNPQIVSDDEVNTELTPAEGEATSAAIPIPQLIVLLILIVLIWWLVTRKKRNRKKFESAVAAAAAQQGAQGTEWADETGQAGQTGRAEETDDVDTTAPSRS